jgi:hypothetical protein
MKVPETLKKTKGKELGADPNAVKLARRQRLKPTKGKEPGSDPPRQGEKV